jgi:hypothetical protein
MNKEHAMHALWGVARACRFPFYFQLDLVLITSDVLQFRDQLPAP